MEELFIQCSAFLGNNYSLWVSIVIAGIIGSTTHCSMMCSPLVAAQMLELKHNKQSSWIISWYHMGRVVTYVVLGIAATLAGKWIFGGSLTELSHIILLVAGLLFVCSAISPKKTHTCCGSKQQKIMAKISLTLTPKLGYFIRGNFMGFIPCGMVVSVLLLVSTTGSVFMSTGLMLLFGISTVPALQTAGLAALSMNKLYPKFSIYLGRTIMAVNGFVLCATGLGTTTIH